MDYKQLYDKSQKMYNSLHILFQDQLQAKDQQLQELANRIKELSDRIDYLTQQLYGSKSEKSRLRLPKNTLTTTAPAHVISPDNAPVATSVAEPPTPSEQKRTTVERRTAPDYPAE